MTREALVFVHGFLGGGAQWALQRAYFSDTFDVRTPDLPGYGERSADTGLDRIEDFAAEVLSGLAAGGVDTFNLVGHSMGGMIAQEMSRQAPARILKQVFYGTGPVGALPGRFETIQKSKERAISDGVDTTGRRISATWFLHRENAPGCAVCADLAVKVSMETLLAGLTAMEHWSGVDALTTFEMPTLILWGDNDRTYPWSQPEQLWQTIPDAALSVVPGCAHAVHLEKPDLFNTILRDFLCPN